jgi:hypothetical protein
VVSRVLLAVTAPPALLSFGMDLLWAMTSFRDVRRRFFSASNAGALNVLGDRPDKARQFSRNRGRDHGG